jgi:hypothetical protein
MEKEYLKIGEFFVVKDDLYNVLKENICDVKNYNKILFRDLFSIIFAYVSKNNNCKITKELKYKKYIGLKNNIFEFFSDEEKEKFHKDFINIDSVMSSNGYWNKPLYFLNYFRVPPEKYLTERENIYNNFININKQELYKSMRYN